MAEVDSRGPKVLGLGVLQVPSSSLAARVVMVMMAGPSSSARYAEPLSKKVRPWSFL
jgi:hypothetical protein